LLSGGRGILKKEATDETFSRGGMFVIKKSFNTIKGKRERVGDGEV